MGTFGFQGCLVRAHKCDGFGFKVAGGNRGNTSIYARLKRGKLLRITLATTFRLFSTTIVKWHLRSLSPLTLG